MPIQSEPRTPFTRSPDSCHSSSNSSKKQQHTPQMQIVGNQHTPAMVQHARNAMALQYGLHDAARSKNEQAFKENGLPFYTIDMINHQIIIPALQGNQPELNDIPDVLHEYARALHKAVQNEFGSLENAIDNLLEGIVRWSCQKAIALAAEHNIEIYFDLAGLEIQRVVNNAPGYTASELREIWRLYQEDPESINHVRFFHRQIPVGRHFLDGPEWARCRRETTPVTVTTTSRSQAQQEGNGTVGEAAVERDLEQEQSSKPESLPDKKTPKRRGRGSI